MAVSVAFFQKKKKKLSKPLIYIFQIHKLSRISRAREDPATQLQLSVLADRSLKVHSNVLASF